jgi:hypothetical protein
MPRRKTLTFDDVLEMGRALPDVEATTSWGAPALKVRGKMFACGATHKSAEPETLAVRMDFDQRTARSSVARVRGKLLPIRCQAADAI